MSAEIAESPSAAWVHEILVGNGDGSLSRILEFHRTVQLTPTAEGVVTVSATTVSAPDIEHDPDANSTLVPGYPDWSLITAGLTGQHGYDGPWLHDSEVIEGGVAERIIEHAHANGGGIYVAVYAEYTCDACNGAGLVMQDDEETECPNIETGQCEPGMTTIEGWAIAYRATETETSK